PESAWELLRDGVSYGTLRRVSQLLPLRHCIHVMWRIAEADDVLVQLMTYHFRAVTSMDVDMPFLLLAQGLEMARALLPGASKKVQLEALPLPVRERLPNGLDWLFETANQRRQTRHAIDKQGDIKLKPDFSEDEERDFLNGANLVLHHVVTSRLGVPLVISEGGASVTLVSQPGSGA
ncbi:MAG: hypothetical protein ACREXY_22030, partial [Gammaproteobacteria bacterium]